MATGKNNQDRPWYRKLAKQWIWRLSGALVWFCFLQSTFGLFNRISCSVWVDTFFSREHAPERFGVYLGMILFAVIFRKLWRGKLLDILGFFTYILFFPLVVLMLLILNALQVFSNTVSSAWGVWTMFSSTKFLMASAAAWPICAYILTTESSHLAAPFMAVYAVSAVRIFIEICVLGTQPMIGLDRILGWCIDKYQKKLAEECIPSDKLLGEESKQFLDKAKKQREELISQQKLKKILKEYEKMRGSPQGATGVFILIFAAAFIFAAVTYAIELKALQMISPGSLINSAGPDFLNCLFMSVRWLSTSSPEGVVPATGLARLLVTLEALSGMTLLVFLIQCFGLILSHDIEEGKGFARKQLESVDKGIITRKAALTKEVINRYRAAKKKGSGA